MDLQEFLNKLSAMHYAVIAAIIAAVTSLIVVLINLKIQKRTLALQTTVANDNRKTAEATRKKEIREKKEKELAEFLIPLHTYLTQEAFIYSLFRDGLPTGYKTLIHFIDNDYAFEDVGGQKKTVDISTLNANLMDEILAINDKIADLIITKGGLSSNSQLVSKYVPGPGYIDIFQKVDLNSPTLPKDSGMFGVFRFHHALIKMAKAGKIDKTKVNLAAYGNFVYPKEMDAIVKNNIDQIQLEIEELSKTDSTKA